jgi:hypothetical protein
MKHCLLCRKRLERCLLPIYWTVHLSRHGIDESSVRVQAGMKLAFGAGISDALGPGIRSVELMPSRMFFVCEICSQESLYLHQLAKQIKGVKP